jgi:hypothetical protein
VVVESHWILDHHKKDGGVVEINKHSKSARSSRVRRDNA